MARLTRQELKKDEFRDIFDQFEQFTKDYYKELVGGALIAVVVVGLAGGLKIYWSRQEQAANTRLGAALRTFGAYVGTSSPGTAAPGSETYPTAREKYQKALAEFAQVARDYPRTQAASIARYEMGVCQGLLGNSAASIRTLQEAGRAADRNIASLAKLALANEWAEAGKLPEALKLYQELADHPTTVVPTATVRLEMARVLSNSQPAQARQIYERLQKEFGSQTAVAEAIKEQSQGLPH